LHFQLDPRLEKDTFLVGELPLCRVLLMDASNFPWIILVPRISNIKEIFQLNSEQKDLYFSESNFLMKGMSEIYNAHKMNIASLGNLVPQLHTHIIVRYKHDDAWPGPVWSFDGMTKYKGNKSKLEIDKISNLVDDYARGDKHE
tara:strand:- start:942 stop:1373 length:432 start_codon:yes stop_codon:yes gene_type:complete